MRGVDAADWQRPRPDVLTAPDSDLLADDHEIHSRMRLFLQVLWTPLSSQLEELEVNNTAVLLDSFLLNSSNLRMFSVKPMYSKILGRLQAPRNQGWGQYYLAVSFETYESFDRNTLSFEVVLQVCLPNKNVQFWNPDLFLWLWLNPQKVLCRCNQVQIKW